MMRSKAARSEETSETLKGLFYLCDFDLANRTLAISIVLGAVSPVKKPRGVTLTCLSLLHTCPALVWDYRLAVVLHPHPSATRTKPSQPGGAILIPSFLLSSDTEV